MLPFDFQCATRILFGRGMENRIGDELKSEGFQTVLMHYGGGSIIHSGLYQRVVDSLREAGITWIELSGVQPNPRVSLVNQGALLCRQYKVDAILAIGGGSVIDSAKCMSFAVYYDGDAWDFLTGKAKPGKQSLPVTTILTIPAAGSESSDSCVITREETLEKRGFGAPNMRPLFSILNPELSMTLPTYQTACGIMDISAHVMERYFSPTDHVELTDRLSEAILKTLIRNAPIVLADPTNYDARAEIMWCGSIGQNDLTGTGRAQDWANHIMEHAISALYDVTHGAGLAVTYCAWMEYMAKRKPDKFVQYASRVWGIETSFYSPEDAARKGVSFFRQFVHSLGLPQSFHELGIENPDINALCDIVFSNENQLIGAFSQMTKYDMHTILELANS